MVVESRCLVSVNDDVIIVDTVEKINNCGVFVINVVSDVVICERKKCLTNVYIVILN